MKGHKFQVEILKDNVNLLFLNNDGAALVHTALLAIYFKNTKKNKKYLNLTKKIEHQLGWDK